MTQFETIFREYYKPLVYFTNGIIRNLPIAEDIVIDVMVKTELAKKKGILKSFLYKSCRNAAVDYIRKKVYHDKSHIELALLQDVVEFDMETEQAKAQTLMNLYAQIDKLPKEAKTIFKLYWRGLDTLEIAKKLGIKGRTVLNQKTRAVHLLKERLRLI